MSQERQSGPARNWTASKMSTDDKPIVPSASDNVRLVEARRVWSSAYIQRGEGRAPRFGSVEWLNLDDSDPFKIAAVVIAAECWASERDNLPATLEAEIDSLRRAHKAAEDAEYVARIAEHREQWKHLKVIPGELEKPRDLYDTGRQYMVDLLGSHDEEETR